MPAVLQLLRLLTAVSCLLAAAVAVAAPGKAQVALVVGIGAYQNAPPLPNPPNDARALADSLKKLGFQVELAVDPDKTRLEQAIKRFGDQLQGAKVGLFFYAGHGLQVSGRNYLVPADAKIDNERSLPFAAVDADLVLTQMETSTPVSLIFSRRLPRQPLFAFAGAQHGHPFRRGRTRPGPDCRRRGIADRFRHAAGQCRRRRPDRA
jgi:uncharacterized caspase-like protein